MANHFTKSGNYYVSAIGGNDSNVGTDPNAPMKTISAAITAAEAAGSGYGQSIIVGTGVYKERLVAANTTDQLVIKGDGNAIVDASGFDSCVYEGNAWHYYDITFVNGTSLHQGGSGKWPNFTRCNFKNITQLNLTNNTSNIKNVEAVWTDCVFVDCSQSNTSIYNRYFTFRNCTFINSNWFVTLAGSYSTNAYYNTYVNCLFSVPSGSYISMERYMGNYGPVFTNCVFSPNSKAIWDNVTINNLTQADLDDSRGCLGCSMASMSFNDNISGSGAWNLISSTMPVNATTKELYSNTNILQPLAAAGGFAPRTVYGEDASSANPLHTDGGATWANIITGSLGGFQISASSTPSGTITTAVIDQGTSKVIKSIGSAWSTTAPNAAAPSTYPSGANNYNPTRYQYEMRYGNTTPSGDYKIFEFDRIPYVDTNGSGSGDQLFSTSSYENISARYLQLRITLRNNMSGSA